MDTSEKKVTELIGLVEKHSLQEGPNFTDIESLFTFKDTLPHQYFEVYSPGMALVLQGRKKIVLKDRTIEVAAGSYVSIILPIPVESCLMEASVKKPFMGTGILFDQNKLAQMLLKMDAIEPIPSIQPDVNTVSDIYQSPIPEKLLDAFIRLLNTLDSPNDSAILSRMIIDEIYYYFLTEERGGALRHHLMQHGQIRQISKAIDHIHQNFDTTVSVDDLADLVNMSCSGFHKRFKEVMHQSPLQYAKSIKLNKARVFISTGVNVSEAGFRVGYNSPAQFSREYKRHFGITPSEEKKLLS